MFTDEPNADVSLHAAEASAHDPLVAVGGIGKRFGRSLVLRDVAVRLEPGEVFGVVGANGGGKTTLLRVLAGVLIADEGSGEVLGLDLTRKRDRIRTRVGLVAQSFGLYRELTVFENLLFRARVYGLPSPRRAAEAVINNFGLSAFSRSRAAILSGGWARRLEVAAALIHRPKLVLMDEPTAGLDAVSRLEMWGRISQLAESGCGVVISTHDLAEAERCDRVALLSNGRVVASGTPRQIAAASGGVAFLIRGLEGESAKHFNRIDRVIVARRQTGVARVIGDESSGGAVNEAARAFGVGIEQTEMTLEDAALIFAIRSQSQSLP